MAYEISFRDDVLCITYAGTLDAQDLRRLEDELSTLEQDLPVSPYRLIDLTPCDKIDLDFAAMSAFTAKRKKSPPMSPIKSAIVATKSLHYGFARMFSMLHVHPDIEIRIFPDENTAWTWLTTS